MRCDGRAREVTDGCIPTVARHFLHKPKTTTAVSLVPACQCDPCTDQGGGIYVVLSVSGVGVDSPEMLLYGTPAGLWVV